MMEPQVCPPSLNSSQSVMSGLDKSPSAGGYKPGHTRNHSSGSSRHSRQHSRNWEVLEDHANACSGIGSGQDMSVPGICEGFLLKKRKYPMKGWHKRYFFLEKGILKYSKTKQDIQRGRLHGTLDVSLAVMSINKKSKRIDLDGGEYLYHLKTKNNDLFYIWLTKLCAHRVFKKNEAMSIHHGVLNALSQGNSTTLPAMASLAQRNRDGVPDANPTYASSASAYQPSVQAPLTAAPGVNSKVAAWLQQTHDADTCSQELSRCQSELTELAQLIQRLNWLETGQQPISDADIERRINMQNLTLDNPKAKKDKKMPSKIFGHSRTMSGVEARSVFTSSHLSTSSNLLNVGASSAQSIPDYVYSQLSTPVVTSPEAKKIQQDICVLSQKVHASLKSVHEVLTQERERVLQAWSGPDLRSSTSSQLATLCSTLSELEVQSRLTKVHSLSLSSGSSGDSKESYNTVRQDQTLSVGRPVQRAPSAAESMSVYYDATDVIACENSSENEEDESDESGLSDVTNTTNSEPDEVQASTLPAQAESSDQAEIKATITRNFRASVSNAPDRLSRVPTNTGRRTVLPAHCVDNSHIGIMSILYNNIGKDLSRVSMPCGLNEPLSLLQRVSEELEYSELLDIANHTEDPFERMLYVGVFSISGYAWATWRNRYKPFNPVLGETYESVREDRGFRYIAEQVSHHPPCSAVHAESKNFTFWQDQRWKNKFWGKSLEIISSGPVHVTLPKSGDHYEWNKAVTCIHNVLSQQRWLEHYGDITIRNNNSDICTCKITFVKSRYWGSDSSKNEVQGQVLNRAGEVVHRFGGLWHEGIFCDTLPIPQCLWKPSVQPEDHYQYYGFSRYARELNELTPELQKVLPPTDTRFRPDQRILEEGDVAGADRKKEEVEQKQRERRKELAKKGEEHMPRFFRNEVDAAGNEIWLSNDTYWKIRERPGFAKVENPDLWC
ncbi:oxysterol-binding protein-related protein 7 isoform X2 [Esox lucius]|uniref:oxysterol-binding protein-related protein 7 isoform X2 n=1 Tax=Esox lucius TaxID=8010 RepID=UPI0005767A03|nr:oxysterol-binding protein-related protein 7 isoform X2 [Esox lucius]